MYRMIGRVFRETLTLISPTLNTRVVYFIKKKKFLNTKNPETFQEKLLVLKLQNYNRNPLVKRCADKYAVRSYLEEKGLGEMLNSLIAVYDKPEQIDWDILPEKYAIKLNMGCGNNIIVNGKTPVDRVHLNNKMQKWMGSKPWLGYSEMQYKDVSPKILIESFLEGKTGEFPEDYKIYCFNGEPKAILYISGRYSEEERAAFFDCEWNYLGMNKRTYKKFDKENLPEKPSSLSEMLYAAKQLSVGFPFVRIDFYDFDGKAVFGEMTFTPAGCFDANEIDVHGQSMSDMLELKF